MKQVLIIIKRILTNSQGFVKRLLDSCCLFAPNLKISFNSFTLILTKYFTFLKPYNQICKEFQKKTCEKTASECAFAHPPSHCPLDQGNTLVIVCVDFIKGKCSRETCKYFHPPEHLVAQLKKQKLANNALAAAAYASNNLGQNHFSPLNITASTGSINQMNSYNPFRLNRQSFGNNNIYLAEKFNFFGVCLFVLN